MQWDGLIRWIAMALILALLWWLVWHGLMAAIEWGASWTF